MNFFFLQFLLWVGLKKKKIFLCSYSHKLVNIIFDLRFFPAFTCTFEMLVVQISASGWTIRLSIPLQQSECLILFQVGCICCFLQPLPRLSRAQNKFVKFGLQLIECTKQQQRLNQSYLLILILGHLQAKSVMRTQKYVSPRRIRLSRVFLNIVWTFIVNFTQSPDVSRAVIVARNARNERNKTLFIVFLAHLKK